ncbi:hypothetical protein WJX77_003066 [Trebouxia sp. C0004]
MPEGAMAMLGQPPIPFRPKLHKGNSWVLHDIASPSPHVAPKSVDCQGIKGELQDSSARGGMARTLCHVRELQGPFRR